MLNNHIKEYLMNYIGLENPQYAILLKGKWGSGKTHFINKYKEELDKKQPKQKYIYVSLYGITSFDEIETKFLEAIYPKLYNRKTIFVGKIAKQLLKATLRIDWNDDKKDDANVNVKIPDFKPEDLLNTKDYILIFDDLERCGINIINLLGYINFFVEHQSYKVILIANEEELEKTDKYLQIKEKLIGKTFEFITDPDLAYNSFLSELKNTNEIKENILVKEKENILELFKKSESKNLRALRQTLLDFERFYDEVLVDHKEKSDLVKDILNWFFLFSFEIRQGNNDILDLQKLSEQYNSLCFVKKKEGEVEQIKYKVYENKYNFSSSLNTVISFELWRGVLINSKIEKEKLKSSLKNSKYYFDEKTPSWKKLTNYYNLEDNQFDELLKDVYEKFSRNEYKDYKQFKLISSMLLYFYKEKLFEIEIDELKDKIKNNFQSLCDEESFDIRDIYIIHKNLIRDSSYQDIGYFDSEYFKELTEHIEAFLEEKILQTLKADSQLIIEAIKEKRFRQLFNLLAGMNNISIFDYEDKPILYYTDVNELFDVLTKTDGETMHYFGGIIQKRYKNKTKKLISEESFLEQLLEKINDYLEKNKNKISSYNLQKEIKENILVALKVIKSNS